MILLHLWAGELQFVARLTFYLSSVLANQQLPSIEVRNQIIYSLIENFYNLLSEENWIQNYIFWELELFKILGYDLEFKELVEKKTIGNESHYILKSSMENNRPKGAAGLTWVSHFAIILACPFQASIFNNIFIDLDGCLMDWFGLLDDFQVYFWMYF